MRNTEELIDQPIHVVIHVHGIYMTLYTRTCTCCVLYHVQCTCMTLGVDYGVIMTAALHAHLLIMLVTFLDSTKPAELPW